MAAELLADVTPWAQVTEYATVGRHQPPDLVQPLDAHGDDLVMLHVEGGAWRISHLCDRRASNRGVIRCAPEMHEAHNITGTVEHLTIEPSILCPDCGLHGYVRDSQWVGA